MSILFPPRNYYTNAQHTSGLPLKAGYRRSDTKAFFRFGHTTYDPNKVTGWSWAVYYSNFAETLFVQLMNAPEKGKFFNGFCRRIYNNDKGVFECYTELKKPVGFWADSGLVRNKKRQKIQTAEYGNVDYDEWPSDLDLEFEYNAALITV
jgi:hypothetical protein